MDVVIRYRDRVKESTLLPRVDWRSTRNPSGYREFARYAVEESSEGALQTLEGSR